jgi:hypothetical protein
VIPLRSGVTAGAAFALFIAGWTVRSRYDGAREAAHLEAERQAREHMTDLAVQIAILTEQAIGEIRVENTTIQTEVRREVERVPVYRACKLPPDGVRLINRARRGPAASQPDGALPAAPAPVR